MSQKPPTRAMRENPDIDQLKRQAKELLEAYRASSPEAIAEVTAYNHSISPDAFALHDAQFVAEAEHGPVTEEEVHARRGRRTEARPLLPPLELRPQLGRAQDLRAELAVGRDELTDDAKHDVGVVAERAEDLVPLEQRLPARPGVYCEVALRVPALAE